MPRYRYHTCAECRHSKDNDTTDAVNRALGMDKGNSHEVKEYTCISCKHTKGWWWFSTWPTGRRQPVSRSGGVKQFV